MTAPKGSWTPPPDQFAPGSWAAVQRIVGWLPAAGRDTETKKQPTEADINEQKLMEMIRQLDELRALEEKTRALGRRAQEWKKWTL